MHFQKPILGTPLDWSNPLNDGLVMHLGMQEGNGDKVQDLSLNGNHGTLNNFAFPPTANSGWNPGYTGIGLKSDGVNDYIDCGNNDSLATTDAITIGCIMRSPSPPPFGIGFIAKKTVGEWGLDIGYAFVLTSGGFPLLKIGSVSAVGDISLSDNEFHIVIATWSAGNHIKVFVDGNETSYSLQNTSGAIGASATAVTVNRYHGDRYYKDFIDQPRIAHREWTANEVRDYAINPWQVYLDAEDM